ncbi:hypothetical protein EZS27_029212 [termite gut metagenome]|uniref:RteC protein n=1 Tax=termite gut metagenome TaxID=433724 RepID=A0A5J4QJB1_9ZZZZ
MPTRKRARKKNVLIVNYLDKAILLVETQFEFINRKQAISSSAKKLKWLGTYVDLVELGYALHATGIFGSISLKRLFRVLGEVFDIDTKNFSRTFTDIKNRTTGDRTKFLNTLKENLLRKLEETERR